MPIQKQSDIDRDGGGNQAMQKVALDLFRYYKVPVDSKGKPLKKNKHGKYYYEDTGEEYNADAEGGVQPRSIMRPVMTEQDLMDKDNFPIQARTLKVKKYQALIQELRSAVADSKSGIVNFVIGRETENADAILKAAFPPGSGVVFKGIDGYNINAANWGMNPAECKAKLTHLLNGNYKLIDKKDYGLARSISDKINAQRVEEGKVRPATPLQLLAPAYAPQQPGRPPAPPEQRAVGGRTPTAPPAGGGAGPAAPTPLENFLNQIEELKAAIAYYTKEMEGLDRFDRNPDKQDTSGLSPARKWENYHIYAVRAHNALASLQEAVPKYYSNWMGDLQYDGSGFIDFQGDLRSIYGKLLALLDPNKVVAHKRTADPSIPSGQSASIDEQAKKRLYEQFKEQMIPKLQSVKRTNGGELAQACDDIVAIISKPYDQIMASAQLLSRAITNFGRKMGSQNKVLIINNAQESGLTAPVQGGEEHMNFTQDATMTEEFTLRERRKGRAVIIVSRVPIKFGFGGVTHVPNDRNAFLVDDEEGEALVQHFLEKCRDVLKQKIAMAEAAKKAGAWDNSKKMPTSSLVNVSANEIKRLAQLICGKTQADAMNFLTEIFQRVIDKETGGVAGMSLVSSATKKNNESIRGGSSWTNSAGETKGIYRKDAKLTMDHYIHSRRTDWGVKVGAINDTIKSAASKSSLQADITSKLQDIYDGRVPATSHEKFLLQTRAENLEKESRAILNNIKHFIILYGAAGCGKSAYPEALANELGFDLLDVDFGQTRGSLVGQTETWSRAMIESWKKLSNVVIRMDEIDGQIVSEESEGRESYNADVMKNLLSFFQDHEAVLEERNIFVVATTNNLDRIRKALRDRADLNYVPQPFDDEGYQTYLEHCVEILKTTHTMGVVYDPDNQVRSKDYWTETEALINSLRPEFPRMAASLVNTGLNFRRLGQFIYTMLGQHMRHIESNRMVRMYNQDRKEFISEYGSMCRKDPQTGAVICPEPKPAGIPFTADNFIRAAQLTYPTDQKGARISIRQRDMGEDGYVHMGVDELERELTGARNPQATQATDEQPTLDFGETQEVDDSLMRPAGADTIASTDYYYSQLVKAGIIAPMVDVKPEAPAMPKAPVTMTAPTTGVVPATDAGTAVAPVAETPETYRERIARINAGETRPDDVIESGMFGVYPVPSPRKVE